MSNVTAATVPVSAEPSFATAAISYSGELMGDILGQRRHRDRRAAPPRAGRAEVRRLLVQ